MKQRGKRTARRLLSLMLSAALVLAVMPTSALTVSAAEDTGLCEHHTEHTAECGYMEAQDEVPCDMGCTDTDGDGETDHADGCSYTPAVAGSSCTYVCKACAETQSAQEPEENEITSESTPEPMTTVELTSTAEPMSTVEPMTTAEPTSTTEPTAVTDPNPAAESTPTAELTLTAGAETEGEEIPEAVSETEEETMEQAQEKTILSWAWVDGDSSLTDGAITLTGETSYSYDAVTALLPGAITAAIEAEDTEDTGTSEEITLSGWTCEVFGESQSGGSFTFIASLPEGYALADSADALTVTVTIEAVPENAVASVIINGETTEYTDFTDAWSAAQAADSATLTLLADVDLGEGDSVSAKALTVSEGQNILLTGSYTLSASYPEMLVISGGSLTLDGVRLENKGYSYDIATFCYTVKVTGGTFTVTSGEVIASGSGGEGITCSGGTVVFYDGSVQASAGKGLRATGGSITIDGGTFSGGNYGLYLWPFATTKLSGGSFSGGTNAVYCEQANTTLTVSDLLEDGYAWYQNDELITTGLDSTSFGSDTYTVDDCTHPDYENGLGTICGAECTHSAYENGICTACGAACTHDFGEDGKCIFCGAVADISTGWVVTDPADLPAHTVPYRAGNGTAFWSPELDENGSVTGGTLTLQGAEITAEINGIYLPVPVTVVLEGSSSITAGEYGNGIALADENGNMCP